MNAAHDPQSVACSTASQAWNLALSTLPPVPRPPFLMHAASALTAAAASAPANTSAGRLARGNLFMSPSKDDDSRPKTAKTAHRGTLPENAVFAHCGWRTLVRLPADSCGAVAGW